MAHGIAAYTDKGDEIIYNYVPYHLFRVIKFTGGGVGNITLPSLPSGKRYVAVSGLYGDGTIHNTVPMSEAFFEVVTGLYVSGTTVHLTTTMTGVMSGFLPSDEYVVSVFVTGA